MVLSTVRNKCITCHKPNKIEQCKKYGEIEKFKSMIKMAKSLKCKQKKENKKTTIFSLALKL